MPREFYRGPQTPFMPGIFVSSHFGAGRLDQTETSLPPWMGTWIAAKAHPEASARWLFRPEYRDLASQNERRTSPKPPIPGGDIPPIPPPAPLPVPSPIPGPGPDVYIPPIPPGEIGPPVSGPPPDEPLPDPRIPPIIPPGVAPPIPPRSPQSFAPLPEQVTEQLESDVERQRKQGGLYGSPFSIWSGLGSVDVTGQGRTQNPLAQQRQSQLLGSRLGSAQQGLRDIEGVSATKLAGLQAGQSARTGALEQLHDVSTGLNKPSSGQYRNALARRYSQVRR